MFLLLVADIVNFCNNSRMTEIAPSQFSSKDLPVTAWVASHYSLDHLVQSIAYDFASAMHGQHPSTPHAKLVLYAYYGAYTALFNFAVGLHMFCWTSLSWYTARGFVSMHACMCHKRRYRRWMQPNRQQLVKNRNALIISNEDVVRAPVHRSIRPRSQ